MVLGHYSKFASIIFMLVYNKMLMFLVNPSLNSHHDNDGMGRGFGRGFRGRGGIRPGMGRAEFIPAEMAMGAHWVGEYSLVTIDYFIIFPEMVPYSCALNL